MAEHAYVRDAQSGAGNCTCGAAQHHRRHPHRFLRSRGLGNCVCGLPPIAAVHNSPDSVTDPS